MKKKVERIDVVINRLLEVHSIGIHLLFGLLEDDLPAL